jgi:hypothetical protein
LILTACGGGGGDSHAADPLGTGAPLAGTPTFQQAPALATAPAVLPVSNSRHVCQDVALGNRRLENLSIPDGASCVLDTGTRIDGNIELGTGSSLYARNIQVEGNIQGQRARAMLLETSRVGGNVQLERGEESSITSSTIDGSIQLNQNGGSIFVLGNQIDSDLQLFQNRAGATSEDNVVGGNIQIEDTRGHLVVNRNRADGNLQCKRNDPAPIGSGNQASSKEDQCRTL